MNILHQIHKHVQETPDRTVFVNRQNRLTYKQLWDQSDALADWILTHLDRDKSPIVVYGHKEPGMIVCFLACVKSGHPYIPADVSTPVDRLERIIDDANAKLILSPTVLSENLTLFSSTTKLKTRTFIMKQELNNIICENTGKRTTDDAWVKENENFYIIYTSGSTGDPKGVQITSNNLSSFLHWMMEYFGVQKYSVFLNQAPLSFDLSVMDLYTSLVTGGTTWSVDQDMIMNPKILFDEFSKANLHIWVSTPSFVEYCFMETSFNGRHLPELKIFLFCGETLNHATAQKLMERFPNANIYNLYGPTEATVAVTSLQITQQILNVYPILPVGVVKADCEIRIMCKAGEYLDEGEKGEIIIVGPSVSAGYYQNQEKSNQSFFEIEGERAYRTGDIGYLENGILFFSGRSDFQVKLQGYRMELGDIEENLRKISIVKHAAVVPKYKNGKCEYLVGVVIIDNKLNAKSTAVSDSSKLSLISQMKKELSKWVPTYMIPRKFVLRESLPLTANGKIDRKALASEV